MILSAERYQKILQHLSLKKSARVEDFTVILDVSANTVRRDLAALEKEGLLKRIQGGAVVTDLERLMQPMTQRQGLFEAEKRAIGREAAKLVRSHGSIILDAGSTTLNMTGFLGDAVDLTVITNSLDICNSLVSRRGLSVIASGGVLLEATRSFVGSPAEKFFESIHADQLFIAAKGVGMNSGLTIANIYESPVKKKMIAAADEVILLADHSKFGKEALSHFAEIKAVHIVVTDSGIDPDQAEQLTRKGIRVILAKEER